MKPYCFQRTHFKKHRSNRHKVHPSNGTQHQDGASLEQAWLFWMQTGHPLWKTSQCVPATLGCATRNADPRSSKKNLCIHCPTRSLPQSQGQRLHLLKERARGERTFSWPLRPTTQLGALSAHQVLASVSSLERGGWPRMSSSIPSSPKAVTWVS